MNQEEKEILATILEDATLIDVDFSNWDKYLSFIFISDHYWPFEKGGNLPILEVRFFEVSGLNFKFCHHTQNIYLNEDRKHLIWTISESSLNRSNEEYHLNFSEGGISPIVDINFKKVEIHEINRIVFDSINLGWGGAFRGFARPSAKELAEMVTSRKKK